MVGVGRVIAEILTIGDEILRGEIVDSNKAYLSERLLEAEIECHYQLSVRDDPPAMADALRCAAERADVVLVSGGLGPTRDDRTTAVVAETFGRELVLDEASLALIRAFFARVGRPMSENNAKQALFPSGAEVLPNPEGTAPGFQLEVPGASVFCLPGVPRELRRMMDEQVLPRLGCGGAGGAKGPSLVRARLLRTFGIGESSLDSELEGLELPPGVHARLSHAIPRQPGSRRGPGRDRGRGRGALRGGRFRSPQAIGAVALWRGRGSAGGGSRSRVARAEAHARRGRVVYGRAPGRACHRG